LLERLQATETCRANYIHCPYSGFELLKTSAGYAGWPKQIKVLQESLCGRSRFQVKSAKGIAKCRTYCKKKNLLYRFLGSKTHLLVKQQASAEIHHEQEQSLALPLVIIWVFPNIGVPQNGWFIMENHPPCLQRAGVVPP